MRLWEAGWEAWKLDAPTWSVIIWVLWFAGWETWALVTGQYLHTYTAHLRPLFIEQPVTWFVALGIWLWLGFHFLAPALEAWLIRSVG